MGQLMREYRVTPARMVAIETALAKAGIEVESKKHMGVMYIFFDTPSDMKKADKVLSDAEI